METPTSVVNKLIFDENHLCSIAREVFEVEANAILNLAKNLSTNFAKACQLIAESRGRVICIGMVVALQGFNTLQKFGAEQELGQLLALSVVRELGPVVSALLFAGRAGSALTAEIGLMRATQQLSSLEMMAVNPLWKIIAPRLWAGFISLPLLTILFNLVAIYGGQVVGVDWLGVDNGSFWNNMQGAVSFQSDILNGIIKSIVFGFLITWISVYQGYYSQPNAKGISVATTKTVVFSSLIVLALDFVLTAVMMGGW